MSKPIRTALGVVVGLMLFSSLAIAQAGSNNVDNNKSPEHHSRLAKAAFWRHHRDSDKDKNAKQVPSAQTPAKQAVQKPQIKPASAKQATASKDQKQSQHAGNVKMPAAKKAPVTSKTPAASKTKPQQKAKDNKKV